MSETEHTPGPWVVEMPSPAEDDDNPDCRKDLCVRMASALRYADGTKPSTYRVAHLLIIRDDVLPGEDPEAEANAALIASAPTLHADNARLRAEKAKFQEALERIVREADSDDGLCAADYSDIDAMTDELKPCPFCSGAVMFRAALWPSDGDCDGIIHAGPTDCPLAAFQNGTADRSIIERWNRRTP